MNRKLIVTLSAKFNNVYSKTKVLDTSEPKLRKKLDDCYSKTGYSYNNSNQERYLSHSNLENPKCERIANKPPLSNTPNNNRKFLSNTSLMKFTD